MGGKADFFAVIDAMMDRRSALRVRYAYRLAKDVHRNQRRRSVAEGEDPRYFEHPRAVALISLKYTLDPDVTIACLLHDVFEDGGDERDWEEVELMLGPLVYTTVRRVSKVPKDGFMERFAAYAGWRELWVKACDRLHNMRTLPPDPAFRAKQRDETEGDYLPLFRRMRDLVPPEMREGACEIVSEIERICAGL